jgi:hypothetical protein
VVKRGKAGLHRAKGEKGTFFEPKQCPPVCCGALWEYCHWLKLLSLVCDLGLALNNLLKRRFPAFSIASLDKQALEPPQYSTEHWHLLKFSFRAEAWVQRAEQQTYNF